uniref:BY PROTMAP: gi/647402707/emb/CDR48922.1/ RHTO0S21e01706g1_1 [Rhodosporidium toruloides] n=1 Tax=Rhodotorula toruloides TaxID=5286 RepID=A0A0K3CJK7_RHOTO
MAGTSEPVGGACLVCRTRTTNRCAACATNRLDLFFCSRACQKFVWIGHKLFCGKNAYPLTLPLLTPSEAEIAIANMDKPAHASSAGGKPRWSVYELAHENLGLTKSEFKNCIEELTEGKDTTLSRWTFEQNQLLLTLAFSANREPGLNAFRADVLNWLIKDQMDAADAGVMKRWLYSANRIEATMLHGLICVFSTLRGALETLDLTVVKKRTSASGPCCKALVTYIKAHFSPSDAQKLFKVFTLDPSADLKD